MGQRGEIFSTRLFVDEGQKTFFFNIKENRYGDTYLNIVESRKTDRGFVRSSIVVFAENLEKFIKSLDGCIKDIKEHRSETERKFSVGGGRREYIIRKSFKGKPAMQIIEKREDASGMHRESVFVSVSSINAFREEMGKAVSMMESS